MKVQRITNPLRVYERQIPFHCIRWKKLLFSLTKNETKESLNWSLPNKKIIISSRWNKTERTVILNVLDETIHYLY